MAVIQVLTIVKKSPNSGFISTLSPSVKIKFFLRSFLHVKTIAICCAATDSTGRSMRLNSSKQPQDPDCARPEMKQKLQFMFKEVTQCQLYVRRCPGHLKDGTSKYFKNNSQQDHVRQAKLWNSFRFLLHPSINDPVNRVQ